MSRIKDCLKTAREANINHYYDLTIEDSKKLYDAYKHDTAKLIFQAFNLGYVQGQKAQRAADKQKAQRQD